MLLIKVFLFFCYCVSCKSVLLSIAPLSWGKYIKTNPTNKRKKIEKNPKPYKRKKTGKKFTEKQSQTDKKQFQCDLCPMSYSQSHDLKRHNRKHSGDKPFPCKFCQKRFSLQDSCKKHERTHTGEKPFQCDECQKCFSQSCNLKRHKIMHLRNKEKFTEKQSQTDKKEYKCDVCQKYFAESANLMKHKKIHLRNKDLQCMVCHKEFEHSVSFQWHKQKHYLYDTKRTDLLKCPLCDEFFTIGGMLYVHIRKHLHLTEKKLSLSGEEKSSGEVLVDRLVLYLHSSLQHIQLSNEERISIITSLKIHFFQFLRISLKEHFVSADTESLQNFLGKNGELMDQFEKMSDQNMPKERLLNCLETMEEDKELESFLLADILFICLEVIASVRSQTYFSEKDDFIEKHTNILKKLMNNKLSHDEFVIVLKILLDLFYEETVPSQIISILNNHVTDRSA